MYAMRLTVIGMSIESRLGERSKVVSTRVVSQTGVPRGYSMSFPLRSSL
jgi:hypothetical protein